MHVNAAIAFARDRARDIVANSESPITFPPALAQCAERVGGFAALADRENQRVRRHRRVAMTKLAGVFHFGWNAREFAQSSIRRLWPRAVPCRIRLERLDRHRAIVRRHIQPAQLGRAFLGLKTSAQRVADGARLLKDFLEHEVRVIAFFNLGCEIDFAHRMLADVAGNRTDLELIGPGRDDIEVVQINCIARVTRQSR